MSVNKFCKQIIFCGAFLLSCLANAQLWAVRPMLTTLQGGEILLKDKEGQEREKVQRAWVSRIATITDRLAPQFGLAVPDLFVAKQSGGPNAFVTTREGRNLMAINTDMLRLVGDDEDLLAVVIAHELGHLKGEHTTKGREAQAAIGLIGALLGMAVDADQARQGKDTHGLGAQLGGVGAGLVNAKYSRDQEREADAHGIQLMAQAGFNPDAASKLWLKMTQATQSGTGIWLSTHPSHQERAQFLQEAANQYRAVYLASKPRPKPLPEVQDPFPTSRFVTTDPMPAEMSDSSNAYRLAIDFHKTAKYAESLTGFSQLAATGDERAIGFLGLYAEQGRGQPIDFEKARTLYWSAASKGFGPAMFALGQMSLAGRGTAKDANEAGKYFTLGAKRGYGQAYAGLAFLYLEDHPFGKDPLTARTHAEKASELGSPMGKALFGALLRDGIGGSTDASRSFTLIQQAAGTKLPWALHQQAVSYERGMGVGQNQSMAIELYRQAATAGFAPSRRRLEALGVK